MNDNTILRIKVPAHLYESVKEQLTLKEAKSAKAFGDWKVVKEKKLPKEKKEKVEEDLRKGVFDNFEEWKKSFPEGTEFKQENNYMMAKDSEGKELGKWNPIQKQGMHADDFQYKSLEEAKPKKERSLDELKAIKEKLEKKIHEIENAHKKEKVEEKEELKEFDPKFQGAMDVLNSLPGIDKIAEVDPFLAGLALVGSAVGSVFAAPKISAGISYLMSKIKDPKKKETLAAAAAEKNIDIES